VTTIYVTHDQVEAMTMGDRVAVMRKGELQQVAAPQELYDRPVNLFVGGFIGSPAMNLVEARLEASGGAADGAFAVVLGDQRLALPQELLAARPALREWAGRELVLGIRPESLQDAALASDAPADRRLKARVTLREALGSEVDVHATIAARSAETEHVRELIEDRGGLETLEEERGETTIVGRLAPRTKAAEGETVELAVDTAALHFFDPGSGLGIYDAEREGAGS
jgi:multiple sugar transport system ATP-binding protein